MIDLPITMDSQDALAQPTRGRLFELLCELKRPAGTTELAERLKLHHNGVRMHLRAWSCSLGSRIRRWPPTRCDRGEPKQP